MDRPMTDNGRNVSLRQRAYERIKKKIVSLELSPGSVIDEAVLQAELDLGRTPIREALQRLSLEKLVVIVPRRGMFVADIGVMDLQRLFEVRVVLECMAARLAAQRGTEQHWQRMEAVLARLPVGTSSVDNQSMRPSTTNFYRTL
jgi:DNA-binding GntR family transcriptional regulator